MFQLNCNDVCENTHIVNKKNQKKMDKYIFSDSFNPGINDVILNIPEKTLNIMIKEKQYEFIMVGSIGKGTYGEVYKLVNKKLNIAFGLKIQDENTEKEISDFLNKKSCNLLKVKYIATTTCGSIMYLMELANGDLTKLKKFYQKCNPNQTKKTLTFYRDVAEEIRNQIVCLLENSNYQYVYIDIKLANILYKCIQDEKNKNIIRIFLGDLGSAVPFKDENNNILYVSTFIPWEYRKNKGFLNFKTDKDKEKALSWMIGILLLSFINDHMYTLNHINISKIKNIDIFKQQIHDSYGSSFSAYLDKNPRNRPDIKLPLPIVQSKKSSKKVSNKSPKKVSKKVSNKSPKKVSKKVSNKSPKKVSKKSPNKSSKKVSKKSPKKVSKKSPNKVSKKVSKKSPNKVSKKELKPCKDGQVRNPLTNRCKKKESKNSPKKSTKKKKELKPCKDGQVRNPLTNRCKKKV